MAKSASRAAASNRLVTEGWKEGWMDRQMDIESRHVMCVILTLSSAHACTLGNVSRRQSDIGTEVFLLFLFIECHTKGFSRISLSLSPSFCLSLSLSHSLLPPPLRSPCQLSAHLLAYTDCNALLFSECVSTSSTSSRSPSLALPLLPSLPIWKRSVSLIGGLVN